MVGLLFGKHCSRPYHQRSCKLKVRSKKKSPKIFILFVHLDPQFSCFKTFQAIAGPLEAERDSQMHIKSSSKKMKHSSANIDRQAHVIGNTIKPAIPSPKSQVCVREMNVGSFAVGPKKCLGATKGCSEPAPEPQVQRYCLRASG